MPVAEYSICTALGHWQPEKRKKMPQRILITGGTGLIGSKLSGSLLEKGYEVSHLSRTGRKHSQIKTFVWDVAKGFIDEQAFEGVSTVVHLAGAGIADERWTEARKNEIIASRVESVKLLIHKLTSYPHHRVTSIVSSSGISYHGTDTGNVQLSENSPAGTDYMAQVCLLWEKAVDDAQKLGIRTVKIRTGIVLSNKGGALPKLTAPIRWGLGASLGTGKQWQSWIHEEDICRLYLRAIEDTTMQGVYNGVAPLPISNEDLTKLSAKILKKPLWLPNVPAFALRLAFGELAEVVLGGNYILNQRISEETDFQYRFGIIEEALRALLAKG